MESLTAEQTEKAFFIRYEEFRNIVRVSYSAPAEDEEIKLYQPGDVEPDAGLWCPLLVGELAFESWQGYTLDKRQAIRKGFRNGLGALINLVPNISPFYWREVRDEIEPRINLLLYSLKRGAEQSGDYAGKLAKLEGWLKTIYAAGRLVPFHPNFEQAFWEQMERQPLHNVPAFLAAFCKSNGLAHADGYAYLFDLLTDTPLARPAVIERAQTWLRERLNVGPDDAQHLADIQTHLPGIAQQFSYYDTLPARAALPLFACHLGELWAGGGQIFAPSNFDSHYHSLGPVERAAFLATLRRLFEAVWQTLQADRLGEKLFSEFTCSAPDNTPKYTKHESRALALQGADRLGRWLNWREKTPIDQLLAALQTIGIYNIDLPSRVDAPCPPERVAVPDVAAAEERPRFAALLNEFERHLLREPPTLLRLLLNQLRRLRAGLAVTPAAGPLGTLPAQLPEVLWHGHGLLLGDLAITKTFWPDLGLALRTRAEWTGRAYELLADALGLAPTPRHAPPPPAAGGAEAPAMADLCRNGFDSAALNRLLKDLDVLTEKSTPAGLTYYLSGTTKGKGGVRLSKTFAALTELHKQQLFVLSADWQATMKMPPYGLTFGEKVLKYEYKSKKSRNQSDTFDAAIEQTQRWLTRWHIAHNSQRSL
ncbi:hypothetical protein [Hymenobacter psoromatis]|uniref:hypothetical protein n=1 Tax=Hymenobacter psoromatis TaxID=1484116 RepID=UPI001CBB5744|nr:hypothetical protein [Hymenobacter psoromatis]